MPGASAAGLPLELRCPVRWQGFQGDALRGLGVPVSGKGIPRKLAQLRRGGDSL
jgi:hypothetical protein